MSGPGGSSTKRDQRRDSRRQVLQQRQRQRELERQRQLRNQRLRLIGIIGGVVLVIALVTVLVFATRPSTPAKGGGLSPATGQTVDGMQCTTSEQLVFHIHAYVTFYVNGQLQTVPPGVGIVAPPNSGGSALGSNGSLSCIYPVHVHDNESNIVHIESPIKKTYTLANLFDLWGQPLSATQVMGNKADATHPLTFYVFDASGKMTQVTTDPRQIAMEEHTTIVILYNSPKVQPKAFTQWAAYNV